MATRRVVAPERRRASEPTSVGTVRESARGLAQTVLGLQRAVGNHATGQIIQRWPLPTRTALAQTADYKGGRFNKGSWAALGNLLGEAPPKPTNTEQVKVIRDAARKSKATFTQEKKVKKVGAAKVAKIQAALDGVVNDCDIQDHVIEIGWLLSKNDLPEEVLKLLKGHLQQLETLAAQPNADPNGELAKFIQTTRATHDALLEKKLNEHREALEGLLGGSGYGPESGRSNYWAPKDIAYELPHVDWKGHVGASRKTAIAVAKTAIPILKKLGIKHKFDTNPKVFEGTNKFLTIYPPPPGVKWSVVIATLEANLADVELPQVQGELPVGKTGTVGMRHGQITALYGKELRTMGVNVKPITEGWMKVMGIDVMRAMLEPFDLSSLGEEQQAPAKMPDIDKLGLPRASLALGKDDVVYFIYYPVKDPVLAPAVLVDWVIKPDPRQHPNPYNVPMPEGVAPHQKT